LTLLGNWARPLPWTNEYLHYCGEQEGACLTAGKWGKRRTNPSCEKLFGPPDPPEAFSAGGPHAGKQRALYDATKDAFALARVGVRLARLPVYDRCDGIELGVALGGDRRLNPAALVALVEDRLSPTQPA